MSKPANDRTDQETETHVKRASETPGDNRGLGDMDGNKTGGASKSTGPTEPESASDDDKTRAQK